MNNKIKIYIEKNINVINNIKTILMILLMLYLLLIPANL